MNEGGLNNIYKLFLECKGVSTDTRNIRPHEMFFALKGPNFNANQLADQAIAKGALVAVIDDQSYAIPDKTILVEDVLETLQQLASFHRRQLDIPVIALTGTNAKTITKELIRAVLETRYRITATEGNLNNHIGVPLTLLSIRDDTEIAVVEMGANHTGEIAFLCEIAAPTHGLITNIGKAHLEGFGNLEGVLRAKSELYQYLLSHEGVVFINSGDPMLENMSKRFKNPWFYPAAADYSYTKFKGADPMVRFSTENNTVFDTQLIGAYNFINIAAAICVGKYFKIDPDATGKAIETFVPVSLRSQVLVTGTNTIIMDAYNANPESMKAAILDFNRMKAPNKTVILGDMLELGSYSREEHEDLGKLLKNCNFHTIMLIGNEMAAAHASVPNSVYFKTKSELERYLESHPVTNSTVLLKASRGIALETVAEKL